MWEVLNENFVDRLRYLCHSQNVVEIARVHAAF
jgi:hypothetical protein